jgi:dipeptidyl aminopeptidase/acylaminoacyl peptidase
MYKAARTGVTLLLFAVVGCALAEERLAAERFFKEPATKFARISPTGRYVAVLGATSDGKQILAVRDTADLGKATVAANFDTARIDSVHWINDNRLGFTLKSMKLEFETNRDEFAVDRDGGNLVHLISGSWRHQQANLGTNLKDRTLTAEYAVFDTTHDGSDDIIVAKYTFNNIDMRPVASRLYRLDTRTRELKDLLSGKQPANVQHWLLDAQDRPRVAVSVSAGRCISWYRQPDATQWTELNNGECLASDGISPVLFDNNDTLYVSAAYKGREALFQYNLATRQRAKEPFVDIDGFDFSGDAVLDYKAQKTLGFRVQADAASTVWLDPAMKALQQKVDALLPQTINRLSCGTDCSKPVALVIESVSDRQPRTYYVYTPSNGKLVGLGSEHPDINPAQMGRRDFYRFAARDGLEIPVYVTTPAGQRGTAFPAVVLVHGGPNVRGGSWEWRAEAQFLASRGYLVIEPEFRGSTGFGFAHFRAGWKQWGQAMQDDLADAATWAVKKGWADPKRIAIMGASYGGYATLMGLIKHPEVFRCGVEWAGVTDIGLMFTRPEADATQEDRNYGMKTLIGDPEADAGMFAANSPLAQAARLRQALLIAHGGQDRRVPIVHAQKFRDAVSNVNRNVEWISYADEGHGWRHEADRIDFWNRVDSFLGKNLATTP